MMNKQCGKKSIIKCTLKSSLMKEVTLKIPDKKFNFFMELIKSLGFIQIEEKEDSREEIIANLKEGFKEMKLYKEGKMKGTPLKYFLNELWHCSF